MPAARLLPLHAFLWPATVLLVGLACFPFVRAGAALGFPYQVDREEGYLLNQAILLSHGQGIYPSLADYPYIVGNYPPLYPLVYACAVKIFGPSLAAGRAINLAAALAILAGLGAYAWRGTRRAYLAALAPALFAATWDFNQWIAYARVDLLALALTWWGLMRFAANPERGGARGTAVLFALALFTRQTMLAAPAAALATLAAQRRWEPFRALLLRLAAYCGGAYVLLFLLTGGRAFDHLVIYNANPYFWKQTSQWARHLWTFQRFLIVFLVLVPVILLFIHQLIRWREDSREDLPAGTSESMPEEMNAAVNERDASEPLHQATEKPFSPVPLEIFYLLFAFGSFLLIGKEGAAANYVLEFHLAAAAFVAAQIGRAERHVLSPDTPAPLAGVLGLLIFFCVSLHAVNLGRLAHAGILFSERPPGARERLAGTEVDEALRGCKGEILSDEPIFAIRAGSPVLFQPFILSMLAEQNLWRQDRFAADLRAGRFAAIVTTQDIFNESQYFWAWTPEMRRAIQDAYIEHHWIRHGPRWSYWVYIPKKK